MIVPILTSLSVPDGPVDVYLVRRMDDDKEADDAYTSVKETREFAAHDSPPPLLDQVRRVVARAMREERKCYLSDANARECDLVLFTAEVIRLRQRDLQTRSVKGNETPASTVHISRIGSSMLTLARSVRYVHDCE